jgi:predicted solute-binding protein
MLHGRERPKAELDFAVPSQCAERVVEGSADIGIVPAIEAARHRLEEIEGIGIAARGEVRSVLLVSRTAPEHIRLLAADSGSRTSVALTRVILAERYGAAPLVTSAAPDLDAMLAVADAALLIGDAALVARPPADALVLDLGAEWTAMTGLPMVFAVWAGCHVDPAWTDVFRGSLAYGRECIAEIARAEAQPRGIGERAAREYLERNVVFDLGAAEYDGRRLFLRLAAAVQSSNPQESLAR